MIIYKPSLGSREVPQKIMARSVQPLWRLLDTNKQTDRQAKYIYQSINQSNIIYLRRNIYKIIIITRIDKLIHVLRLENCYSCSCFHISSPVARKKNEDKKNTVTVLTVWWCMVLVGQVDLIEENRERLSFNYDL